MDEALWKRFSRSHQFHFLPSSVLRLQIFAIEYLLHDTMMRWAFSSCLSIVGMCERMMRRREIEKREVWEKTRWLWGTHWLANHSLSLSPLEYSEFSSLPSFSPLLFLFLSSIFHSSFFPSFPSSYHHHHQYKLPSFNDINASVLSFSLYSLVCTLFSLSLTLVLALTCFFLSHSMDKLLTNKKVSNLWSLTCETNLWKKLRERRSELRRNKA